MQTVCMELPARAAAPPQLRYGSMRHFHYGSSGTFLPVKGFPS
jgi:hypothetical protein